jgi:hypothetical protein
MSLTLVTIARRTVGDISELELQEADFLAVEIGEEGGG